MLIFVLDTTMYILVAFIAELLWAWFTFLPNDHKLHNVGNTGAWIVVHSLYVIMKDHAYFGDYICGPVS